MPRLRNALVLGLLACAALMPWSQGGKRGDPVEPARADRAEVPGPAPSEPPPFALLARFGEARLGHPVPVRSLALSPDRTTLATTTRTEPVVRLWDVVTGRLVREVRVRNADNATFTLGGMSADALHLLAVRHKGYSDRDFDTEREWGILDARSGDFRHLGRLAGEIAPPVVSPGGTMIGGISERGELTIWSFDPATPPRAIGATDSRPLTGPNRVAFSPDGNQIAACLGQTLLVAPTDGGPVRKLKAENYRFYAAAFWPRPGRLVAAYETMMTAFDPVTGRALAHTDSGKRLHHTAVVAGGVFLGRDYYSGELVTIDPDTLTAATARMTRENLGYGPFIASADGKVLAVACGHAVRLLDAATGAPLLPALDRLPSEPADRFEFSADGRRMLAAGGGTVQTFEMPNGRLLASLPVVPEGQFSGPSRVALSPDGRWVIASSTYDMQSVVRDAETGAVVGDPGQLKEKLLIGLDGPDRVWLVNRHTGDLASHPLPRGPAGPAVSAVSGSTFSSPNSRWFVASRSRDSLRIRDTRAADTGWVELESYRDQPFPACGRVPPACAIPVRFSPDGRFLLTWWRGYNLWHVTERRVVRLTSVRDHTRWYPDAAFSPDGRRLAAVVTDDPYAARQGQTGSIRVWETASGSEAFRFEPPGGATGCTFTPDGKRLIVAHPDTTFSVWDYAAIESRAVRAAGDTWDRLASRDAKAGLGAIDALATDPTAVAVLRERFRPADAAQVARLIAQLEDDDYATREAAEKALSALAERAEKGVFAAATGAHSPEVRGRAGRLLGPISGAHSAARLRAGRAVEALERIGTPAATELLSEWAKERGSALAAEAEAALARPAPSR